MGYISEALSFEGFGEDIHTQIAKLNVVIKSNLKFNPPNVLALHNGLFGKPLHLKKKTSPMTATLILFTRDNILMKSSSKCISCLKHSEICRKGVYKMLPNIYDAAFYAKIISS